MTFYCFLKAVALFIAHGSLHFACSVPPRVSCFCGACLYSLSLVKILLTSLLQRYGLNSWSSLQQSEVEMAEFWTALIVLDSELSLLQDLISMLVPMTSGTLRLNLLYTAVNNAIIFSIILKCGQVRTFLVYSH